MFETARRDGASAPFTARWASPTPRFAPWGEAADMVPADDQPAGGGSDAPAGEDVWALGFAAGRAQADADLAREAAAMDALLVALDRLAPCPPAVLTDRLEREVRTLLAELVGTAGIDEALLAERCAALAEIAAQDSDPALHAHPDDAALLTAAQPQLCIVADASLPRGELLLIDGMGEAASGPRTMLADWASDPENDPC